MIDPLVISKAVIAYGAGGNVIVNEVVVGIGVEAIETFEPSWGIYVTAALCIPATGIPEIAGVPVTVIVVEVAPAVIAATVTLLLRVKLLKTNCGKIPDVCPTTTFRPACTVTYPAVWNVLERFTAQSV